MDTPAVEEVIQQAISRSDIFTVLGVALFSAVFSEAISWLLIYRTEDYQRLKRKIDQLSKKVEKQKDTSVEFSKQKQKDKKIAASEDQLKSLNRDMSMVRMKSTFVIGFTMIAILGAMSTAFEGTRVAKIPFTPFGLVQNLSHRGLTGTDYTDCSMIFLYLTASFAMRNNLQKFLGFTPPKGSQTSMFAPPAQ
eukprot:GILJ01002838.1.p1 GENE.GILJ01002838.1~~GILJ01002838.1.p1  ORF type:complete len:211 (-),score=39.13 GILJ01002838.1:47-625(-)